MKNIIKTIIFALLFAAVVSCENDKGPSVSANGFELRKDATIPTASVLTSATATDVFAKFDWDRADNGPATVSSYVLQIFDHNDTALANPVEYTGSGFVVTASSRTATLTVAEFNNMLNQLPTFKCSEMDIDVRVKSTLGINADASFVQYSSPINIKITAYPLKPLIMAFVKDGNTVTTEPRIASSGPDSNADFEGHMYLEAGNYKFYQPDACGDFTTPTIYGGNAGAIDGSGSAPSINIAAAGHYLVKVNLSNNTYTVTKYTTFGIFGKATRTGLGFDNQVPFDYDPTTKTWSSEVSLIKGRKFKFKANLWTGTLVVPALPNPPYAPGTATTYVSILGKTATGLQENTVAGSGDITVPGIDDGSRDTYKIVLDVSHPRAYTYTMTKI